MEILNLRAMRGPNYWSIREPFLIQMRVDLKDAAQDRTDRILAESLEAILPGLRDVRGVHDSDGHFLQLVEDGIGYEEVVAEVALALQREALMEVQYQLTRRTRESGIYLVVFAYEEEEAGREAGRCAVKFVDDLVGGTRVRDLEEMRDDVVQQLREIREDERFGPSTGSIVDEASRRDIPHIRLDKASLVQLGYGRNQQRIQASMTERTSQIAVDLAGDKYMTKQLLSQIGVPTPQGVEIRSLRDLQDAIDEINYPVAIKPLDSNQGKGITTGVEDYESAENAFEKAREYSREVIIEKSLRGVDFRALVVANKLVAVAQRTPAHVIGDGRHSVMELVEEKNRDPRRGFGHENVLTKIVLDDRALRLLDEQRLSEDSVPEEGQMCVLKSTANLSTGGTAEDITDEVHPENVFLFERIAHFIGLDVAGVDVVAPNLSTSLLGNGGGVVEVNAAPGLRMHLAPSEGEPRNVAKQIVDMLFAPNGESRIPLVAITGTNGKTTTTRLIGNIFKGTGKTVGYTTSDGVYVANYLVESGDTTGPRSAQMVLMDPEVEVAVLETARGGILRAGLGFDRCDVAVVTNIAADHLGLGDIETIEDMARVKSVVVGAVSSDGWAVLNAEDDLVYEMRKDSAGQIALFSLDPENERIVEHVREGGLACVLRDATIVLLQGRLDLPVEKIVNIPITYGGQAMFMVQNALAATLAGYCQGIGLEDLRDGLSSFSPSMTQIPGRLNLVSLGDFSVLIDYAHNPAGMENLAKFLKPLSYERKIAVIGGTGDRRDEDIRVMGQMAARLFQRLIVREDDDLRGREPGETSDLVVKGVCDVDPDLDYERILDSDEATRLCLNQAEPGDLVTILGGDVQRTIEIVTEYREKLIS